VGSNPTLSAICSPFFSCRYVDFRLLSNSVICSESFEMPQYTFRSLALVTLFLVAVNVFGQARPETKPTTGQTTSLATESFVVESLHNKIRFESDGTGFRELVARIRIQSEASLRELGLLVFSYNHSAETLDILYVRSRKSDGSIMPTELTDVQDLDSEISRSAPMYADEREKHIAVKFLSVGDTLEYRVRWNIVHPLAPGNFWFSDNFLRDDIVENEEIEINLPKDYPAALSSPSIVPITTDDGVRRTYTFRWSHLEHDPPRLEADWEKSLLPTKTPDIQVSSFASWSDVGKWFSALVKPQVKITPDISAKAEEITHGKITDREKIRAIYDFVSTRFRYISISLGAGRYSPHSSPEVLANQFGDCKDKHTLFAALLQAVGLKAYPALVSSGYSSDPTFATPDLFDHVITAVPQGNSFFYLDTTPEVAPFGFLSPEIRDKFALVIPDEGQAHLLKISADPSVRDQQQFAMDASLDETGTLDGKARLVSRGDAELIQRQAFTRTARTKWQELVQNISGSMGFAGTVSDISAAEPESTVDPFWISYSYHRPNFPDWENRRIATALPFFALPLLTDQQTSSKKPLPLGWLSELTFSSKVRLPTGYSPELPSAVEIKRNFAVYTASYSFEGGILVTTRRLVTHSREIPAAERPSYASFAKSVQEDEGRYITLIGSNGSSTPHSINPEAQRVLEQGRSSMMNGDSRSAISFLERAVELDPKWSDAWMMLGSARLAQRETDSGLDALRKAVILSPTNSRAYKVLGFTLMSLHRDADAIQVWRDLLKANADDRDAPANLGALLFSAEKYEEARGFYETAVSRSPDSASITLQFGRTCLRLGDEQKSTELFQKALKLQPGPEMLNSISYELADMSRRLPEALQFATEAVRQTEDDSSLVRLDTLDVTDFRRMSALAAEWDTLGWVKFRMGDFETAGKYLEAAWYLMQSATIGEHLAEAYEKLGKHLQAWHTYLLAYTAMGQSSEPKLRAKLSAEYDKPIPKTLMRSDAPAKPFEYPDLSSMRTITLPQMESMGAGYKSAEFAIAFMNGSKVVEVRFLSGAEELRSASARIATSKFDVRFPDAAPTRIIRRGVLSCSPSTKKCTLVLYPVEVLVAKPQVQF
jgi:tetratricopeptide (TPR) repeat protein